MSEWRDVKISDLCDSVSITHKLNQQKIILINTSDVYDGKVINHLYVENANLRGQFKKSFQINDILYSEIRPKNKRYAYVDFVADDYVASTKLMVLRYKNGVVLPEFLYQILKSDLILDKLQMLAETRSGTFPQITFNELGNIHVMLPSLPEQSAIASMLFALDDKIELNNRINKNLEAQAQAIFKSWFVDFEPFRDGEFVDSELGPIPKGWRVEPLSSLLYILKRVESFPNAKEIIYEHYSIPAFDDKKYPAFDLSIRIKSNKTILESGCFLVSKLNPSFKRLWRPFMITNHAVTSTEFVALKPLQSNQFSFCYAIADSDGFYSYLTQNTTGSTGSRQRVSPTIMLNYRIAVPPKEWICSFCKIVDNLYQLNDKLLMENQTLTTIRDTLLPKLMSGEIRVPLEV